MNIVKLDVMALSCTPQQFYYVLEPSLCAESSQIINDGYMGDPRLQTSFPHRSLFEAGRFGRKTGHGNYLYDDAGVMADAGDADHSSEADPAVAVVLVEAEDALQEFAQSLGCRVMD